MTILLWLVLGGMIGWIASIIMRTDASQGPFLNVVVGVVGALVGGLLLSPMFGRSTINHGDFTLSGLVISLLGSIVLLTIVNLVRRGTAR